MARHDPAIDRPHMPGYGIVGSSEGSGLLPWSWAEERVIRSHDYWLATVWPDGRPHVMPVWGVWLDHALWFSSSGASRKTQNLKADARCTVTTDDAYAPVVMEAIAHLVTDTDGLRRVLDAENEKYGTDYGMDMLDPAVNACFRLEPTWAFGLMAGDFTGSPTRWTFSPPRGE